MHSIRLKGILPPLTTPFNEVGDVDFEGLSRNVKLYNETGLGGYVALGSNGEVAHLSTEERVRVIETIKREAAPGLTVVAGVNEHSTRAAIEAARRAAEAGADAALVITPYFYKSAMTRLAFERHFEKVADHSPIPVLLYNVPQNTGVVIDSLAIASLAAHPNIIGVKDSAGNFAAIAETIRLAPKEFTVLTGNGGILYPSLMMGARGAVLAVACAAPRACVELFEAVEAGHHAKARELQNRISPLSHLVTAGLGVAGLKAAMGMAGLEGGAVRAPLVEVEASDREKIRVVMRESGLFPNME
ncbi:MAG TPA: dihydrodipicolinate synthase family protein [Blastocatellia bacterium]|nr:dihydrodipicolinate synthase family protein [Blastocatellia bacterium]